MRYVKNLNPETIKLLRRIHKYSKYHKVRQRALCILLSYEGYSTGELVKIFKLDRITIYNWFNRWRDKAFVGLYDKKGRGRKAKLTLEQQEKVKQWAKQYPKNMRKLCFLLEQSYGINVCTKTVKRILHRVHFT